MDGRSATVIPPGTVVRYGRGSVSSVPELVESLSAGRVLIVHGARSFEESGASRMLGSFDGRTRVWQWYGFAPDPDIEDLERGLALVREMRPDTVVAVGGGSAMDMAKMLCAFEDVPPHEIEDRVRSGEPVDRRRMGLALVPTTAGSGSEATHFAVLYVGDAKFSVSGRALLPDAVAIDPELSESCSAHRRAVSGMDAVSQAIESLWAVGACEESRNLARRGLKVLLSGIEDFVLLPHAGASRAMAVGSHLAGRAINLSRTTGAHALSYGLTRRHGVDHGHAVALTLGAFMDVHTRAAASDLRPGVRWSTHRRAVDDLVRLFGASDPAGLGESFAGLGRRLGLAMELSAVGVRTSAEARELAGTVNAQRLRNNPVDFSHEELTDLLMRC
ncbi:phosphonoacetaldehyde reductase [Nocardiopsis sp. NPDC101807]|uniref:phosphonoacetaldehyde reductase n=1 Tax=Nocardiopsis sp. NPDC101807 TaxID=3364339 RepID=UPI00381B3AA1